MSASQPLLPNELAQPLGDQLLRLNSVSPHLGRRTFRYVVLGDGEDVLAELRQYPGLRGVIVEDGPGWDPRQKALYLNGAQLPPAIMFRLGQVYAAILPDATAQPRESLDWLWGLQDVIGHFTSGLNIPGEGLLALFRAAEVDPGVLVRTIVHPTDFDEDREEFQLPMKNLPVFLAECTEALRECLTDPDATEREVVFDLFGIAQLPAVLLPEIVTCAMTTSKQVFESALAELTQQPGAFDAVVPWLADPNLTVRNRAAECLATLDPALAAPLLQQQLAHETTAEGRRKIERWFQVAQLHAPLAASPSPKGVHPSPATASPKTAPRPLPPSIADPLSEQLLRLNKRQAGLGEAVYRYVVEGKGEAILQQLQGMSERVTHPFATLEQILEILEHDDGRCTTALGGQINDIPPALLVRLGRVYRVCSRHAEPTVESVESLEWLFQLMWVLHQRDNRTGGNTGLRGATLLRLMREAGVDPALPLQHYFESKYLYSGRASFLRQMDAKEPYLAECVDLIRAYLLHPDPEKRAGVFDRIGDSRLPDELLPVIAECAVMTGKLQLEVVQRQLRNRPQAFEALLPWLSNSDAGRRTRAAEHLWELDTSRAMPHLQERLDVEKATSVRRTIERLLEAVKVEEAEDIEEDAASSDALGSGLDLNATLSDDSRARLTAYLDELTTYDGPWPIDETKYRRLGQQEKRLFEKVIEGGFEGVELPDCGAWGLIENEKARQALQRFYAGDDVTELHWVRILELRNRVRKGYYNSGDKEEDSRLRQFYSAKRRPLDVLRLAEAMATCETTAQELADHFLLPGDSYGSSEESLRLAWEASLLVPFFSRHLHMLARAMGLKPTTQHAPSAPAVRNGYEILAAFPELPASLVPAIWVDALSGKVLSSSRAQRCLESQPDKIARLSHAVEKGETSERLTAAKWLGRLGDTSVIPLLQRLVKKVQDGAERVALLSALEELGAPMEEVLAPEVLLMEAEKGLQKGIPKPIEEFPFDALPNVRWAATNEPVDPRIPTWWLVQSHALKKPEGSPFLRRLCHLLVDADRESLGQWVLESWIAWDEQKNARSRPSYIKGDQPFAGGTPPPGLLGVAAVSCGSAAVPMIQKYVYFWYGYRTSQCKALVAVAAQIETSEALAFLLNVPRKVHTAGIQKAAQAEIDAIAQRNGWTVGELEERTAATGDLDESGRAAFTFAGKSYTLVLSPQLELEVRGSDGKAFKAFPTAGHEEDPEGFLSAHKQFKNAKSAVKTVLKSAETRFSDALRAERTWRYADWDAFIHRHPIMGRVAASIIWQLVEGDSIRYFRPLGDGTLTDAADHEVPPGAPDSRVQIAHAIGMDEPTLAAWRQHLTDYNIKPALDQFTGHAVSLAPEQAFDTEWRDLSPETLTWEKFNRVTKKYGYLPGPVKWHEFVEYYVRHMPTAEMEVRIEVGDSPGDIAGPSLSFHRRTASGATSPILLGEVPQVLLAMSRYDVDRIAKSSVA